MPGPLSLALWISATPALAGPTRALPPQERPPMAGLPCTPVPPEPGRSRMIRGHAYVHIGDCGGVPVLRTDTTDSTFRDRDHLGEPVVLVTGRSVDPTAQDGDWPAPPGNLYLSVVLDSPMEPARARVSAALEAWRRRHAPRVPWTEAWDGAYGAHRAEDGRYLSGVVLEARPEGTAVGLDLHVGATPAAYERLGKGDEHVTLDALTGRSRDLDATLWQVLELLLSPSPAPPAPRGDAGR